MKFNLLLLFCFIVIGVSAQKTLYVSLSGNDSNPGTSSKPLLSIQKAIDLTNANQENSILLKGGVYQLPKAIELNHKHSNLKITNFENEKVVISGGKKITNWKKQKNGWWICDINEVKSGNWNFNQLYVNDKIRMRARKPNNGFLIVKGMPEGTPKTANYHKDCQSFEFQKGDINPNWKNIEDVEVIVYHFWTDSHLPIQSIDQKTNIVKFKHKAGKVFTNDFSENGARYIVENVYEELDTPGEWYLDRKSGKCYYYPFPDEKIENTEIYAAVIPQLIRFNGNLKEDQAVSNIAIENIEFRYTNWQLPVGNSNDNQGSASVPAAINLTNATNCSFTNCSFSNLGNWAFELNKGCKNNVFSKNEISYVAAGGFRVNGGNYNEHINSRTSNNKISYNHIHHYGEVYPSAVGILLQHTEGNLVEHNLIHNGYYTGISIGWSWGYQRSVSRDNIIEFNHIHTIGQGLLSDMGAIYTLGVSPGTIIRNNLIHDVSANHYGGWGIYNDEGTTHILVENNIVYNTKFAGFNIHFCKEVTVRNNIFAFGKLQQLSRSRVEPHKSVYFEQNIVYWTEGVLLDNNWTDKPYKFYFHPKNESGLSNVNETFDMDFNLYFNPKKSLKDINFNGKSWSDWQASGKDKNSIYTDPLFEDPDNFDFRLKENSPAFQVGFKAIDIEEIGLKNIEVGPRWKTD